MEFNKLFTNTTVESSEGTRINCSFSYIPTFTDFLSLTANSDCYKHSIYLTVLLLSVNLTILVLGWYGNLIVIYVAACKLRQWTTSSLFIVNLAVADSFVLLFCLPPALLVNAFRPWVLGRIMCKCVTYAQGVSVFVSVYSLAAISLDRCQALRSNIGTSTRLTNKQALTIIFLIWLLGMVIPIPWLFVFKLTDLNSPGSEPFPYCIEAWPSRGYELGYFLFTNLFILYLLPFLLIFLCNMSIWRIFLQSRKSSQTANDRNYRVLKVFTFLTFAFFLCWLPLYLMMTRVKVFYSTTFQGNELEKRFMAVAVPIGQLFAPVNSCLNPVLYSILNKSFRDSLVPLCCCCRCCCVIVTVKISGSPLATVVDENEAPVNPEVKETSM